MKVAFKFNQSVLTCFELYFDWMLPAVGADLSSKNAFMVEFPPTFILASSESFHLSMVTLRTKERWTPKPRCLPEHSRQIQMP